MKDNLDYISSLESKIARYARTSNSLTELCRSLGGPTPIEVLTIAKSTTGLWKQVSLLIEEEKSQPIPAVERFVFRDEEFPEPLIIDSDWRYTNNCAENLVDIANIATTDFVLCLGSPTIFATLVNQGIRALMIDRNSLICDFFNQQGISSIICADINHSSVQKFVKKFNHIFLDPPWYVNEYYRWISVATAQCLRNGNIYLPIYSESLRPAARSELSELYDTLYSLKFRLEEIDTLDYVVPKYERNVLNFHGLETVGNWRTAKLLRIDISSVERTFAINKLLSKAFPQSNVRKWKRFGISGKSYAIEQNTLKNEGHYSGRMGFLDSVSARSNSFGTYNFVDSENNVSFIEMADIKPTNFTMGSCTQLDIKNICINLDNDFGEVHAGYFNSTIPQSW